MNNPILVQALRGDVVESFHRGALAVVNDRGHVMLSLGDVQRPIFPRSAVKVLQALPLITSGAADALGLSDAELALACASHGGEEQHVRTAASMLAKAGVDVGALECGTHWPSHDASLKALARRGQEPTALNNNCSGKHAGFICVGCLISGLKGAALRDFVQGYVEPQHPVMQTITQSLAQATDCDLSAAPRGTDGCSIPTFGIPLKQLALAFARVGTGQGLSGDQALAAQRLRRAVAREPGMVAGTGRLDTRLMERLGERLFCKVGAEGVYCAAFPERGWGVAIKMDDGNTARAVEIVMARLCCALLELQADELDWLASLHHLQLRNWQGRLVGHLQPATEFEDQLRALGLS